jgi:hypothetical protein
MLSVRTRKRRVWSVSMFVPLAMAAAVSFGCVGFCPRMPEVCDAEFFALSWEAPRPVEVSVPAGRSRIDFLIDVVLTEEGAASPAADSLRTSGRLLFYADPLSWYPARNAAPTITAPDGADVGVSDSSSAYVEHPLADCVPGAACRRMFRASIVLTSTESTTALASAWFELPAPSCDAPAGHEGWIEVSIRWGWTDTSADCVERTPSAPPVAAVCTPEQATCYRACTDRSCRMACAATSLECSQCFEAQEMNCTLASCAEELRQWDCCLVVWCAERTTCAECDGGVVPLDVCRSTSEFAAACQPTLDTCFPP